MPSQNSFFCLGIVNKSNEELFVHLAEGQEAVENLDVSSDIKLAIEEKLEDNLLSAPASKEIIEALQGMQLNTHIF